MSRMSRREGGWSAGPSQESKLVASNVVEVKLDAAVIQNRRFKLMWYFFDIQMDIVSQGE